MGHDVLLVEDDADNAMMLAAYLRRGGHAVVIAPNAAIALAMAVRSRPTVVIVDIGLPNVDGFMLARRLRETYTSLPIIAVTGHATPDARRQAEEAGIGTYLVKPVDLDELDEVLAAIGCQSTTHSM
jgi:DNA-binding response OmpR family regulator